MWTNEAITGPYALLHRSPRESDFQPSVVKMRVQKKKTKRVRKFFTKTKTIQTTTSEKSSGKTNMKKRKLFGAKISYRRGSRIFEGTKTLCKRKGPSKQSHPILIVAESTGRTWVSDTWQTLPPGG